MKERPTLKMANLVTQVTPVNLCLGFVPPKAPCDPDAWKRLIGNKPVCTRLETLPETKPHWSAFLTSTVLQIAVTGVVIAAPALFPDKLINKSSYDVISILAPQTELALPEKKQEVPERIDQTPSAIEELLPPQRLAKLIAPTPLVPAKPKPTLDNIVDVPVLNEPSAEAKFEVASSEPARPREAVKMGSLAMATGAGVTVGKPPEQVQTGGFGDPNGLPGESNLTTHANVAHAGSIALLPGPGYGDGAGGEHRVRGTAAKAGFGESVAIAPASNSGGGRGTIKPGAFEAATTGSDVPKPRQTGSSSAVQPVVILAKPNPLYSDEARQLGLEGEVLVDVIFLASGQVQVVRVSNGLGHGLDEAAVRAAQQIRFKPALQDGKPVDFPATIHIEFQLAF